VLRCYDCGLETDASLRSLCEACDGRLRVVTDTARAAAYPWGAPSPEPGVWRFAPLLPAVAPAHRVTLFEGGTPLLDAGRLAAEIGVARLLVKDETRNPTGSFKDRCLAVGASVALECGASGLICASTGNAGASTAAYAARAGVPAVIVVPSGTPMAKVAQAAACGATVVAADGRYSDAWSLAVRCEALGYANTTTTFISPYSAEAGRTVAFELHEELAEAPDWIVVPIGAGPLLAGLHQGYADLRGAGLVDRVPRLLAVQPEGCAPIVRALASGADEVTAWEAVSTVVGPLADQLQGYEREGRITLEAIRGSGGAGLAISDDDTLAWVRRLAQATGIFAEPAAAIALAGAERGSATGLVAPADTVVCCVTGTGLKQPLAAVPDAEPAVVPADADVSLELLRSLYERGRR
jgi:threonine synthase